MGSGGGGGGGAPSTPPFNFEKAQEVINKATQAQKETIAALEAKAIPYEEKREKSQAELATLLTGRTPSEAVKSYEQRFEKGIGDITSMYAGKQERFTPGLLNMADPESSASLLANVLRGSAQEYTKGMDEASRMAGSRLKYTLATPLQGFEYTAQSPAFRALRDPVFIEYAKRPPTVTSDIDSYRQLMTYNV